MKPFWQASWGHVGVHVGLMLASFFVMFFCFLSDVVLDPNMVGNRSQNRAQSLPKEVHISDLEIGTKHDRKKFDFDRKTIDFLMFFGDF